MSSLELILSGQTGIMSCQSRLVPQRWSSLATHETLLNGSKVLVTPFDVQ